MNENSMKHTRPYLATLVPGGASGPAYAINPMDEGLVVAVVFVPTGGSGGCWYAEVSWGELKDIYCEDDTTGCPPDDA